MNREAIGYGLGLVQGRAGQQRTKIEAARGGRCIVWDIGYLGSRGLLAPLCLSEYF